MKNNHKPNLSPINFNHPPHRQKNNYTKIPTMTTRPIIILGPTAGGKSDLAAQIANSLSSDVVSADSMQIYKHMDAGTAKPDHQLRKLAKHHMVDTTCPTQRFTVSNWLGQVHPIIQSQLAENKQPVIVGGTNLYINSLLQGIFQSDESSHDPQYRKSLESFTPQELHITLTEKDPDAARRIHPNDQRRIIRALEVHHVTGQPISQKQTQWSDTHENPYQYNPIIIGLRWNIDDINPRINLRVKAMFYPQKVDPELAAAVCINGESLIDETARLEDKNLLGPQAREALGYKQVLNFTHGNWTEEEAYEKTKILTRRFGKTQRTWLKRFQGVNWIDMTPDTKHQALEKAQNIISSIS